MFRTLVFQNINNAVARGIKAMPSKDGVSDNSATFSGDRHVYAETHKTVYIPHIAHSPVIPTNQVAYSKKWSTMRDASQLTAQRRSNGVGTSLNLGGGALSFETKHDNSVSDALRRTRAGGAVVPKKVAASPHYKMSVPHAAYVKPVTARPTTHRVNV